MTIGLEKNVPKYLAGKKVAMNPTFSPQNISAQVRLKTNQSVSSVFADHFAYWKSAFKSNILRLLDIESKTYILKIQQSLSNSEENRSFELAPF